MRKFIRNAANIKEIVDFGLNYDVDKNEVYNYILQNKDAEKVMSAIIDSGKLITNDLFEKIKQGKNEGYFIESDFDSIKKLSDNFGKDCIMDLFDAYMNGDIITPYTVENDAGVIRELKRVILKMGRENFISKILNELDNDTLAYLFHDQDVVRAVAKGIFKNDKRTAIDYLVRNNDFQTFNGPDGLFIFKK